MSDTIVIDIPTLATTDGPANGTLQARDLHSSDPVELRLATQTRPSGTGPDSLAAPPSAEPPAPDEDAQTAQRDAQVVDLDSVRPRDWLLRWTSAEQFRTFINAPSAEAARDIAEEADWEVDQAEFLVEEAVGVDGEMRVMCCVHVEAQGQALRVDCEPDYEGFDGTYELRPLVRSSAMAAAGIVPALDLEYGGELLELYGGAAVAHALGMSDKNFANHVRKRRCIPRSVFKDTRYMEPDADLYAASQVEAILSAYAAAGGSRRVASAAETVNAAVRAEWGALALAAGATPMSVGRSSGGGDDDEGAQVPVGAVGSRWVATWTRAEELRTVVTGRNRAEADEKAQVLSQWLEERRDVDAAAGEGLEERPNPIEAGGISFLIEPPIYVRDFRNSVHIAPVVRLREA